MSISVEDDLVTFMRTLGELTVAVLAMHMTEDALTRAARALRATADTQDTHERLGVAIHPANRLRDPAALRMLASFYEAARTEQLANLSGEPVPAPGHFHTRRDGIAEPPGGRG